jgi:deoxyribodipyrimidine photo-lyase
MLAARRTRFNFALDRAVHHARTLGKPLVILEALRCDYRWASDRIHRFVLDGMADNARRLAGTAATYYPFVERSRGEGKGLVAALASHAAVVVTDDALGFFFGRAVASAARQVDVAMEEVDGSGLLPYRDAPEAFPTAFAFRRFLQKALPSRLAERPSADPLARAPLHTSIAFLRRSSSAGRSPGRRSCAGSHRTSRGSRSITGCPPSPSPVVLPRRSAR